MNDNVARYYHDPAFRTIVDTLRLIIRSATLAPSEVREAAMTACVIEEMHRPAAPLDVSPAELEKIRASWAAPRPPLSSELTGRPGTRDVQSRSIDADQHDG